MFGSFKAYSPSYELHRAEGVLQGPRLGLGLGDNKYRLRAESLQKNLSSNRPIRQRIPESSGQIGSAVHFSSLEPGGLGRYRPEDDLRQAS
jgi:hypothetical protein